MRRRLSAPLRAKDGRKVQVIAVARVSSPGKGKQDIRSNDDQEAMLRSVVAENVDGLNFDIKVIAGTGSGEDVTRPDLLQLRAEIKTGKYDVVITEDFSRIARRLMVIGICELCLDHGTRLIALNDNVDTDQAGWMDSAFFSAYHAERSNRDTSDRIKRTNSNRLKDGGELSLPIFGYIKAEGAKDDSGLSKDPFAEPIYKEWFRRLDEEGASFQSIADWLNASGVPTGPYAENEKWDGRMVGRITRNPILKGERFRNERQSYRLHVVGKYKTRKAPPEARRTRIVPHLAFFEACYWDLVIAGVNLRNSKYARKNSKEVDALLNRPKKRTRYPGQCGYCGICDHMYVFGGHGQTDHLMCDGARSHQCWNGATIDGPLAAQKISTAIMAEIEALPGFDDAFLGMLSDGVRVANESLNDRLAAIERELITIESKIANIVAFVAEGVAADSLRDELRRLEELRSGLCIDRLTEQSRKVEAIVLPPIDDLKALGRAKFTQLALEDYDFAAELRRFTPRIVVFPYRLVDGGPVVLRAQFRLQLAELVADAATKSVLKPLLERVVTVDLFDPPQREIFRLRVVQAREAGEREQDIANRLGITKTAAQHAMALQRLMDKMGVIDAYQPVTTPPTDGKLQRHKHARYRFEPLPDAGQV